MGRPGTVHPASLADTRACLNCDEPFVPAKQGWQALYCTVGCWRADTGGPRRHTGGRPAVEEPVEETTVPAPSRLVVVGTAWCPACDTHHEVYGYRGER